MSKKDTFVSEMMAYEAVFKAVDQMFAPADPVSPIAAPKRQEPEARLPLPAGMPQAGFTVAPDDVYVVDGDTIQVTLPHGHLVNDENRVRIRLRSLEAPELPMRGPVDDILKGSGRHLPGDQPGLVARSYLRNLLDDRQVHVVPVAADRYGRVLGDVYAGEPGNAFDAATSISVEREMMKMAAGTQRVGEPLPRPQPVMPEEEAPCLDLF